MFHTAVDSGAFARPEWTSERTITFPFSVISKRAFIPIDKFANVPYKNKALEDLSRPGSHTVHASARG